MTVGNTPLVEIEGIYAKLECTNPMGSIKDRIAKYILDKSEENGLLKQGMEIVEATSGNTGIAMAYFAKEKGYPITIVMPENMTEERKKIMKDLGANLILNSKEGSFREAAQIRDKLAEDPKYLNTDQFSNPFNIDCHQFTTGKEILEQLNGTIPDAFVAGVGTGGTLIGVAKALKQVNSRCHIVAVEPIESNVMSGGSEGEHTIPGIGDGFIPAIAGDGNDGLNELIDEVICISSSDAKNAALSIKEKKGFCVGISSGANFLAAKKLQSRFKNVVTVFADGYHKYKTHGLKCSQCKCQYRDRCAKELGGCC